MNWIEILQKNMPGAQFSIDNAGTDDDKYASLIFHDENVKPLYSQFQSWQSEHDKEMADTEYQRLRQAEYPGYFELLVALWEKDMENRPEAADALEVKRQEIKAKYPKPGA